MLSATSFVLQLAEEMATGPDSTNIGGARSSTPVSLTDYAAVFFPQGADGPGGDDRVQHAKIFDYNSDPSVDAEDYGVFIANALPDLAIAALFSVEGSEDDDGKTVTFLAFTVGGDPISESFEITGGEGSCSTPMKGPVRVIVSEALEAQLTISHGGVEKGLIPGGGRFASSELDIGLEAELDGDQILDDPSTPPVGVTFSRPATAADRLLVDGSGTLPAQSGQGLFLRWTQAPEMLSSEPVQAYVLGYMP